MFSPDSRTSMNVDVNLRSYKSQMNWWKIQKIQALNLSDHTVAAVLICLEWIRGF